MFHIIMHYILPQLLLLTIRIPSAPPRWWSV
jgi:hypothetical protein